MAEQQTRTPRDEPFASACEGVGIPHDDHRVSAGIEGAQEFFHVLPCQAHAAVRRPVVVDVQPDAATFCVAEGAGPVEGDVPGLRL